MSVLRLAAPACAMLAFAIAGCSGPSDEERAANNRTRAAVQAELETMKNSTDGSAAAAVGDMMADPEIQAQLGMGPSPAPPMTVTPTDTMDQQLGAATAADTGQAAALASCRAMRNSGGGTRLAMGQAQVKQAAADLAADPNALSNCVSAM